MVANFQIDPSPLSPSARVLCGMDTRVSGPHLTEAAKAGAALIGVDFVDFGWFRLKITF